MHHDIQVEYLRNSYLYYFWKKCELLILARKRNKMSKNHFGTRKKNISCLIYIQQGITKKTFCYNIIYILPSQFLNVVRFTIWLTKTYFVFRKFDVTIVFERVKGREQANL